MWEYMKLPLDRGAMLEREWYIRQQTLDSMKRYNGTVFFFCAKGDRERLETFLQSAKLGERRWIDGTEVYQTVPAEDLAANPEKKAVFVDHRMEEYLGRYLSACPIEERHLLVYSRRQGNGPSPHRSRFLDFWLEQNVDVLDLRDMDRQSHVQDLRQSRRGYQCLCDLSQKSDRFGYRAERNTLWRKILP